MKRTTRQIYLDNFEKLSESEIANLAGVSRQRIHQLEQKFQVCKMSPSLYHKHYCIDCNTLLDSHRKNPRCHECAQKERTIELECPTCSAKFRMSKKEYNLKIKRGQRQFYDSRKCFIEEPSHASVRKWNHEMIWQKHLETHFGALKLSRLLNIPHSTISKILAKERRQSLQNPKNVNFMLNMQQKSRSNDFEND